MWVRLPLRVLVTLFVGLSLLLLLQVPQVLQVLQVPQEPTCPHSHHFFWVITESRLHLVNRVALESIFLHHPTAALSHWRTTLFLPLLWPHQMFKVQIHQIWPQWAICKLPNLAHFHFVLVLASSQFSSLFSTFLIFSQLSSTSYFFQIFSTFCNIYIHNVSCKY